MTSLTAQAKVLLAQAEKLDAYLEANKIPYASPSNDTLEGLPKELQGLRMSLADNANEMKKLARGSIGGIMDVCMAPVDGAALRITYHYKLAQAVPLEGSASYSEIASASGLDEGICIRTIRTMTGCNVFDEGSDGRVRHTAVSRLLATDQSCFDCMGLGLEEVFPAADSLVDVWKRFGFDNQEPTKSAYLVHNDELGKSFFDVIAADPERIRRFGSAMTFMSHGDDLDPLLTTVDWSAIDKPGTTIVDVGGGLGTVSRFLAQNTSNIRFVIQDLPDAVRDGIASLQPELKDRVRFEVRDFLQPYPDIPEEQRPTAFMFRFVLHNWPDKYFVRILKGLIPGMKKGSKVFLIEHVLNEGPVKEVSRRFGLHMDLMMRIIFNAMERRIADFERLLKATDERFQIRAVHEPQGTRVSVVEVDWTG